MEDAYAQGLRSVFVEFCLGGDTYSHCYHFTKVELFIFIHSLYHLTLLYYRFDSLALSVITKSMLRACTISFSISHHHNSQILLWPLLNWTGCLSSLPFRAYWQMMYHYGGSPPSMNGGWMKTSLMPSLNFCTSHIKQEYLFFLMILPCLSAFFFQHPFSPMHDDTTKANNGNTPLRSLIFNSVCC